MVAKIDLYNAAALYAGERFLASLTEETEIRRLLDHVYSTGGVKYCLEEGQWYFAMRTMQIDYDPSVEPQFGYNRAFTKPDDWVLTAAVCSDEFFRVPLVRCVDEAGYWYSDIETIFVRYVSSDNNYGGDIANWPQSFFEFVAAHFASKIILKISNDTEEEAKLVKLREQKLREAKNRALMAEPTMFPARGNWVNARNRFPYRKDSGYTSGNLY